MLEKILTTLYEALLCALGEIPPSQQKRISDICTKAAQASQISFKYIAKFNEIDPAWGKEIQRRAYEADMAKQGWSCFPKPE